MEKTIWVCIIVNVFAGLALFLAALSSGQDAAGKGMILLPMILLIGFAVGGYFLMKGGHTGWALALTGIPAVIVVIILCFTFLTGRGKQ